MWTFIFSGFVTGIIGSLHCAGMCGPIAFMLPVEGRLNQFIQIGLYNFGRIITYTLLGIIVGVIGNKIAFWGFQRYLTIGIGILLVLSVITSKYLSLPNITFIRKLNFKLQTLLKPPYSNFKFLNIGLLNGLLPCGLVLMALSLALASGQVTHGGQIMMGFGLGTVPMMAGIMYFKRLLTPTKRQALLRFIPIFIFCTGALLILRGLNLGIPYVSPKVYQQSNPDSIDIQCHPIPNDQK